MEASDRGGKGRRGAALSLEDCCCPVCLEIFMEPVTLPCTHTFCKDCFLESVDKSTLCCPLCRKRVSTWARQNSRNNTLVNQQLWAQIQTSFPLQCQRRLSGQDVVTTDGPAVFFPRVSQPGELRREYEDQVTKLTEEKRVLDEEERKASEEYIQRLLAEEEELLQEERRRREDDEKLARLLSNQLNSAAVSQGNLRPADVTPAKKKKEVSAGQIEKFLCPRPSKSSSSVCSLTANKENILISLQAERPPPQLDYYGDTSEDPDLQPTFPSASEEDQNHRDGEPSSAKRKSSELEAVDEEVAVTKRVCHSPPSSSSSSDLEGGGSFLQLTTETMELQNRRQQQEEEDWRLALLLQKELDQEERQKATNRRKGSSDAYLLRQNRKATVEASSSDTPSRASRKTPKTSSSSPAASLKTPKTSTSSPAASVKTPKTPSSSSSSVKTAQTSTPSSSSRGSKQATLTEMFTCLSS